MSQTPTRPARRDAPHRTAYASPRPDAVQPIAAEPPSDRRGDAPFDVDGGEIVEGGMGLGAFYAYQMAARSIEQD